MIPYDTYDTNTCLTCSYCIRYDHRYVVVVFCVSRWLGSYSTRYWRGRLTTLLTLLNYFLLPFLPFDFDFGSLMETAFKYSSKLNSPSPSAVFRSSPKRAFI